jgi:hypothetical protein
MINTTYVHYQQWFTSASAKFVIILQENEASPQCLSPLNNGKIGKLRINQVQPIYVHAKLGTIVDFISIRYLARRVRAPFPKSSRRRNLGLFRVPTPKSRTKWARGPLGHANTLRGFPKHEAKHKVGHTKEVGARRHEECI